MNDPFNRPLDRHLEALRRSCGGDAYRLIPGEGDEPDCWHCKCPAHPDAGRTLVLFDRGEDEPPGMFCSVGCSPKISRWAMGLDPEADARAEVVAKVLVWKEQYAARRAA